MPYIDFVLELHKATGNTVMGGYRYDGRWRIVARKPAEHYQLKPGQKVLDVGCGMAHLLYELTQDIPLKNGNGCIVSGNTRGIIVLYFLRISEGVKKC